MTNVRATFLVNNKVDITFIAKTPTDLQKIKDDGEMVILILSKAEQGVFKDRLKQAIYSIARIENGKKKLIFFEEDAGASCSKSGSAGSDNKSKESTAPLRTEFDYTSSSEDSSDSDDGTGEEVPSSTHEKNKERARWTDEQEDFLVDQVTILEKEVGRHRKLFNIQKMYEEIAKLFNDKFGIQRTWQQMFTKRKNIVKRLKEGKPMKKRKVPERRRKLRGLELAIELLQKRDEEREKERKKREEIQKQEMLEREERFFQRLEKLMNVSASRTD